MKFILQIFQRYFPFILTLLLWEFDMSFWNPSGILALITVFYYTFVKPIDYFIIFGTLICFLIDYRCDLLLFWTFLYLLFYVINGFQNHIDLTKTNNNALYVFMFFIGIGILILFFRNFNIQSFFYNIWIFSLLSILYFPITIIEKKIHK